MTISDQAAQVVSVTAPAVAALGLLVEDVSLTPAGKRRTVRITIDRDLGYLDPGDDTSAVPPLTLDEIAEATRAVDAALDEYEPLGAAPYSLEVTSPGVDRALRERRHYRRNVGRLVDFDLGEGGRLTARMVAVGPQVLTVVPESGEQREIELSEVVRARVQVEFGHAPTDDEES
ncbi:ribosome maturation factor RimP [Austwickia chelonae]|uniref:Ribosome maturation factor RimP n=1 Tax=Austwickia chelonae NBRC 105200 TaxID=1184607 RepID=K6V397_9MICO|nr:ribosome maturation factor RimP [Austwickia chelonae]GAB76513.1 ribosome maturation factor RimP [Austwickia chelonae NBRC 105200]SEW26000.1 ribosome maturation factor RimP [Austwickia chelonae]